MNEEKKIHNEPELINLHRFNLTNSSNDRLQVAIREGHPRFTVFINDDDKSKSAVEKMIIAPFIFTEMNMFLSMMKQVLTHQQVEFKTNSLYNEYIDGVKQDNKIVRATTRIFKDTDNVFKLGLSSPEHKEVLFELMPSEWFKFFKDGEELTKDKLSLLFSNSWVNTLEGVLICINAEFSIRKFKKSLK